MLSFLPLLVKEISGKISSSQKSGISIKKPAFFRLLGGVGGVSG
jgi:hypothetical protein